MKHPGDHMKKTIVLQITIAAILALSLAFGLVALSNSVGADQQDQNVKFQHYRKVINDTFQIDITKFKDRLKGGMADGKVLTDYDLERLLTGIKIETEHTSDKFIALEIAMDHLERIPDFYSRLARMERKAMSVKGRGHKTEGKFEVYRNAIRDAFQIDIKDFNDKLRGGMADGKPITKYDLGELVEGIKWEREHADDSLIALEITMDHLEKIPDYNSRLCELERACVSDRLLQQ
jgi:endoglucanase Acf2